MGKLVPGRECGDCNVCCTALTIDKPDIQKKAGVTCRHCTGGCAIHETRPQVCRNFYCGWRLLPSMGDEWRPDRSGVFALLETDNIPAHFKWNVGINLMLVGDPLQIVREPRFITFVATGVANAVPLFLVLPGPPGHQGRKAPLNTKAMIEAASGPRLGVGQLLEAALKGLMGHPFKAYTMTNSGHDMDS